MERPSGPSRGRSGEPDGELNGRENNGLGGRRLNAQQQGQGLAGGQRSKGQPGLGGRRLNGQQGRQGLGGHRNANNGQGLGTRPATDAPSAPSEQPPPRSPRPPRDQRPSRPEAQPSRPEPQPPRERPYEPQPSRDQQYEPQPSREQRYEPQPSRDQRYEPLPPAEGRRSRSAAPVAEHRSAAAVAPPAPSSAPPAEPSSPYRRDPQEREEPLRPRGSRAPERPPSRPMSPPSDPYDTPPGDDPRDQHTVAYGASPYDGLDGPAQSPDRMSTGRRVQNRMMDSRAGRYISNTGALNLFSRSEEEPLDGTAPPIGRRAPSGRGGGPAGPKQGYHRVINYPQWGKRGFRRWLPSWKLVTTTFFLCVLGVVGVVFWFYNSVTVPTKDPTALAQTTTVYFAGDKSEIGKLQVENRENIELAQVPKEVQQAVLAAEDHTFYENSGINPSSIARAALAAVKGGNQQGGSTISQQYVKNVYDQKDLSYKRKLREAVLAIKINKTLRKDKILERYLNTIYWGRGAWGIQAASKAYFDKDVEKLTPSEGAYLAGIINAPEAADPRKNAAGKERAEFRWGVVTAAMEKYGWLSSEDQAKLKFPKVIKEKPQTAVKGQNAYLMETVQEEAAKDLGISEDALKTGGYAIHTTFNQRLVKAGAKAVKDTMPSDTPKGIRIGMASINPTTGAVLSIYGGTNINKQLNQATKDRSQGASTFKAFALMAALEDGYSLDTTYKAPGQMRIAGQLVHNDENENLGWANLIEATAHSVNTVYVQLNNEMGPKLTRAAAIKAGIPKDTPDLKDNLVNVLGSANVHPIDLASAYGTIADQGVRHPWFTVSSITEAGTGKELYSVPSSTTKGVRVFDKDKTADATYALQDVVKEGTGVYAQDLGRPVAGKTGTSSDSNSAWFVGFTPQVVTAVGMHEVKADGKSIEGMDGFGGFNTIVGGSFPVRIWTRYMKVAMEGKAVIDFEQPNHGGEVMHTSPTPSVTQTTTPSATPTEDDNPMPTQTQEATPTNTWQTSTPTVTDDPGTETPTTDPVNGTTTTTDDGDDGNGNNGGGGNGNG